MLLDLFYFILCLLHVSLEYLLCLGLDKHVPAFLLGDASALIIFIDLGLETMLLLVVLLGLVEELLALVRGWGATSLNVLFNVVGYCRVIQFTLDVIIHVFAWISLLRFWRLFTRLWMLLLRKRIISIQLILDISLARTGPVILPKIMAPLLINS